MPKAFTEAEKQIIRQRLLEQGDALFTQFGLKKTSVEELARNVGISKAAFYLFYDSKESLFMDVVESAEQNFRQNVLTAIDLPGPTPRARLVTVFTRAFTLWKTIPLLQSFSRRDYDFLYHRVPPEKIEEHLASDQQFMLDLVTRCQQAGIPLQAPLEQIGGLMYALFVTTLHEELFGPDHFNTTLNVLVELTAAYCLGEVPGITFPAGKDLP